VPGPAPSPRARLLTNPRGEQYWFDAGATCLDFGLTGGEGDWSVYETLHAPADLQAWMVSSPLAVDVPTVTDADLAAAKYTRHAITVGFFARAAGDALPDVVVDRLNAAAARLPLVPRLAPDGTSGWAAPATVEQVVSTLAREAIEILAGPMAERIKVCAADDCGLVFVDTSRPGSRRWCSMDRCGNRAKLRTHRARHTTRPTG
jgi:predicted RNA-binding Zn ribbon-like protein